MIVKQGKEMMMAKRREKTRCSNSSPKLQGENSEPRAPSPQPETRVAVIIPAYNEETRIGEVLKVVNNVPLVDEIIVVNDGSTDRTAEVVKRHNVKLLNVPINEGKGAALKRGIDFTDADVLVSLDADLVGLTEKHVENMLKPLFSNGDLSMTVGKFESGRKRTDWAQKIAPSVSGQRAFRRSFLKNMSDFSDTGYGVEVAFTRHAKNSGAEVEEVLIDNATHVMKEEKLGLFKGIISRAKMYTDIIKHWFVWEKN